MGWASGFWVWHGNGNEWEERNQESGNGEWEGGTVWATLRVRRLSSYEALGREADMQWESEPGPTPRGTSGEMRGTEEKEAEAKGQKGEAEGTRAQGREGKREKTRGTKRKDHRAKRSKAQVHQTHQMHGRPVIMLSHEFFLFGGRNSTATQAKSTRRSLPAHKTTAQMQQNLRPATCSATTARPAKSTNLSSGQKSTPPASQPLTGGISCRVLLFASPSQLSLFFSLDILRTLDLTCSSWTGSMKTIVHPQATRLLALAAYARSASLHSSCFPYFVVYCLSSADWWPLCKSSSFSKSHQHN